MTREGILLSESQRRALGVSLRHIERDLVLVEHLLDSTYEGVLTSVVDDVTDAARERLREGIAQARALIREAHDAFVLEREEIPKSRSIAAHLVAQSVVATECESRYLAGYGEVMAELSGRLDPLARRLSELLRARRPFPHCRRPLETAAILS
jgi:hypothetical protein